MDFGFINKFKNYFPSHTVWRFSIFKKKFCNFMSYIYVSDSCWVNFCMRCEIWVKFPFFWMMGDQLCQHCLLQSIFSSTKMFLHSYWSFLFGSISEFSVLPYGSMCLFLCHYYIAFLCQYYIVLTTICKL
jgi:hypothetical protein